jgi:pantoate--beta-alanine ligase
LLAAGERDCGTIVTAMLEMLAAADGVEYAELRQVPELSVPSPVAGRVLLAVAARVGPARLIDNFVLDVTDTGVTEGFLLGDPNVPGKGQGRN